MRILITGGTGRVGRPITEKFIANGWSVRVIGAEPDCDIEGITYTQCDIRDYEAVQEQVEGCEAIVHLAAIPHTLSHPAHDIFSINVSGTYNLFEAASKAGIKRIAQASSINAIGSYWGFDDRKFDYFPLDEDHNRYTTDVYSFSKQMVEDLAQHFWQRDCIVSTSFRMPGVWTSQPNVEKQKRFIEQCQKLDEFITLPDAEQKRQIAEVREQVLAYRAGRFYDYEARQSGADVGQGDFDNWLWSSYFADRYNYWSFVHTDDTTQAFEKAITADYEGAHPLFINSDKNYLNYDSETLLRMFFPDVKERRKPIRGSDTLISNDRARDLIDYEPSVHSI